MTTKAFQKSVKKDEITIQKTLFGILLVVLLVGGFIGADYFFGQTEIKYKAKMWEEFTDYADKCSPDKFVVVQYNGSGYGFHCLSRQDMNNDFLSRSEVEALVKWFQE